jgi:hypothetical protein
MNINKEWVLFVVMFLLLVTISIHFVCGDDDDFSDMNTLCSFFGSKDCESGPCVWKNNACKFDTCLISVKYNPCPQGCEDIMSGKALDFFDIPTKCRAEGAYIDYCMLGYSLQNPKGNMERCTANTTCEAFNTPQSFVDYFEDYFEDVEDELLFYPNTLCLTKNRNAGNHQRGTYNYDPICGFFPEQYCNGGPCVWTGGKCIFDECVLSSNLDECPGGCNRTEYVSLFDQTFCWKSGKEIDSCFVSYGPNVYECKLNDKCTVIDFPTYLNANQMCVLKSTSGALFENKRFGIILVMLLAFMLIFV